MTDYIFKKIDLGISGKGLMIYRAGEVQEPILVLLESDVDNLLEQWKKRR